MPYCAPPRPETSSCQPTPANRPIRSVTLLVQSAGLLHRALDASGPCMFLQSHIDQPTQARVESGYRLLCLFQQGDKRFGVLTQDQRGRFVVATLDL